MAKTISKTISNRPLSSPFHISKQICNETKANEKMGKSLISKQISSSPPHTRCVLCEQQELNKISSPLICTIEFSAKVPPKQHLPAPSLGPGKKKYSFQQQSGRILALQSAQSALFSTNIASQPTNEATATTSSKVGTPLAARKKKKKHQQPPNTCPYNSTQAPQPLQRGGT